MMKKQPISNNNKVSGPTCGNCIHNPSGYRCCIFRNWAIMPDDLAEHCEYRFPRVEPEFLKYYKHKPQAPRGWLWDEQIFQKMILEFWEYLMDIQKGIITDNNGGYFTRWPFKEKIYAI